jgi:hypothetical protein
MGGDKSGGAVQSSTTKSEPWEALKDPILSVLSNAQNLYSQPYQAYQGQTVAGPSDSTVAGYNLGYQRATLGAPDLNAARGSNTDISTGSYLNKGPTATNSYLGNLANGTQSGPTAANGWLGATANGQNLAANPYLTDQYTNNAINFNANQMGNAFATGTAANNDALAARGGAFGGSAWQQKQTADAAAMAGQVGNMANTYNLNLQNTKSADYQNAVQAALAAAGQRQSAYGMDTSNALNAANMQQGAYQSDMANMQNANALAGQLSQDDWKAADYLRSIGAQQEGYQQSLLDSQQKQWQEAMNAPYQQMQAYANTLSQFAGTGSTGQTQMYGGGQSPWGTIAGLGLTGAGLLNAYNKG